VTERKDHVLDHDYDGIREYDNRLPNWWLAILFGTVAFAFAYWFYYQTFGVAPTPEERLQAEVARAAEAQLARAAGSELTDESLALMASIPERVAEGQSVFKQFCVVCHGEMGEGKVGPNLTDGFWLHGARPLQIHGTVTNGVTEKGMAAWGNQLGPTRVEQVTAYVLTLKGKNVPGKEPQGDPAS
jgi:cytochrome c oxidase cbb3-type subunit 3